MISSAFFRGAETLGWDRVVDAFVKFKNAKHGICEYHLRSHYRDVSHSYVDESTGKRCAMYLYHGFPIAWTDGEILRIRHYEYHTPTTRDRLNAILSALGLPFVV